MVFEANPYFFKGAAKTPNLSSPSLPLRTPKPSFWAGQVDMLGSETLAGLTEQLVQAEADGKVKNVVNAGATWEHIDINMFVK